MRNKKSEGQAPSHPPQNQFSPQQTSYPVQARSQNLGNQSIQLMGNQIGQTQHSLHPNQMTNNQNIQNSMTGRTMQPNSMSSMPSTSNASILTSGTASMMSHNSLIGSNSMMMGTLSGLGNSTVGARSGGEISKDLSSLSPDERKYWNKVMYFMNLTHPCSIIFSRHSMKSRLDTFWNRLIKNSNISRGIPTSKKGCKRFEKNSTMRFFFNFHYFLSL